MKKALAFLMAAVMLMSMLTACGNKDVADDTKDNNDVSTAEADQAAADKVAALIDAIYVQERNENTDAQCEAAKAAWDALTDAQKEMVEGEEASPEYFGRDTGDASKDDARNQDNMPIFFASGSISRIILSCSSTGSLSDVPVTSPTGFPSLSASSAATGSVTAV